METFRNINLTRVAPKAQIRLTDVKELKDENESRSASRASESSDKILGMPKMVAYGLGAVIVLVGGYFAYKKFKK